MWSLPSAPLLGKKCAARPRAPPTTNSIPPALLEVAPVTTHHQVLDNGHHERIHRWSRCVCPAMPPPECGSGSADNREQRCVSLTGHRGSLSWDQSGPSRQPPIVVRSVSGSAGPPDPCPATSVW